MSQSQAAAEQVLYDHNCKQQWVDITLGMTKKQIDNCNMELAAIPKRDKEHNQDYNFEEGNSINPREGHKDNDTTITLAMKVS